MDIIIESVKINGLEYKVISNEIQFDIKEYSTVFDIKTERRYQRKYEFRMFSGNILREKIRLQRR